MCIRDSPRSALRRRAPPAAGAPRRRRAPRRRAQGRPESHLAQRQASRASDRRAVLAGVQPARAIFSGEGAAAGRSARMDPRRIGRGEPLDSRRGPHAASRSPAAPDAAGWSTRQRRRFSSPWMRRARTGRGTMEGDLESALVSRSCEHCDRWAVRIGRFDGSGEAVDLLT